PSLATGEESPADMGFEITHAEPVTFEVPSMNVNTTSHDTADHGITLDMTTLDLSDTQEAGDDKKVMDMSGISLDIEETPSQAINLTLSADEPTEVDTKLDLVAAYLDMDDKVGAKELLDEVMKEGGPAQRKRAEEILQTLA
ncbi:MAG TPA: FimV/HubP family polar landmark protein, partial [Rugosibacter sp.]|nr:FimV/HubP family polar landmark protein [Rugosibacter sp.]